MNLKKYSTDFRNFWVKFKEIQMHIGKVCYMLKKLQGMHLKKNTLTISTDCEDFNFQQQFKKIMHSSAV